MTIGAIGSYSTSTQYWYFGTSISDDQIQFLMDEYHIVQTDNQNWNLEQLYNAMYSDAKSSVKSARSSANVNKPEQSNLQPLNGQNSNNVPWASLMTQVSLYPTGNFETDYKVFQEKISAMLSSAATQQAKASVYQLIAEASIVFVQPTNSPAQLPSQTQNSSQPISGADIIAQLNRMYFLG